MMGNIYWMVVIVIKIVIVKCILYIKYAKCRCTSDDDLIVSVVVRVVMSNLSDQCHVFQAWKVLESALAEVLESHGMSLKMTSLF